MNDPAPQVPAGRRLLRFWLAACAGAGLLLFLSQLGEIPARSALRGYDNTFNYLWLRSAMTDGDWDFRNDLEECNTLVPEQRASALALPPTKAGRIPNKYGLGWALLTVPSYLLADATVIVGQKTGWWSLPRDGYSAVYQVFIQLGHAALALGALVLAARAIASWLGDRAAAVEGVALAWAASPLLYYQTVNVSMSHGAAFFCIAVLAVGLAEAGRRPTLWWPWLLAGAGLGLAVITRYQLAIFAVVPGWVMCAQARSGRALFRPILGLAVGAVPFVGLQAWAWRQVYGEWFLFSYGAEGEGFRWTSPEVVNSLFSPWHGLFYWHPFLLVAMAGMLGWVWERRGESFAWLVAVGLVAYVNAAWWCWWFASSFGNRAFDAALLPLMAGVAWMFSRGGPSLRAALWTMGIVAGVWNFYLVVLFRTGAISRHLPVTWVEMVEAAGRLREALPY